MGATGASPESRSIAVIGPQFCAPCDVELNITKKALSWSGEDFDVTDAGKNVVLKVRGKALSLVGKRILEDVSGNELASLQPATFTMHERWNVFRGNSSNSRNLLFSVKKKLSFFRSTTKLHVFFANNRSEKACDLMVKGNFFNTAFTVYHGDSSTCILAKMKKRRNILWKDTCKIIMSPHVDYALVVALFIIFKEVE